MMRCLLYDVFTAGGMSLTLIILQILQQSGTAKVSNIVHIVHSYIPE